MSIKSFDDWIQFAGLVFEDIDAAELAWSHQQKKIDELELKLSAFRKRGNAQVVSKRESNLIQQNQELVEALEFYADKNHWLEIILEGELRDERVREGDYVDALISLEAKGYDIAKQALAKVKGEE